VVYESQIAMETHMFNAKRLHRLPWMPSLYTKASTKRTKRLIVWEVSPSLYVCVRKQQAIDFAIERRAIYDNKTRKSGFLAHP